MTTLRKRPNVDLISPGELAELGRDLAFAQRRIDVLDEEELALERKYKFLKSELRREREYLKRESARVIEAIIYQFKLSDVSYEDEVKKVLESLVEVDEQNDDPHTQYGNSPINIDPVLTRAE